jgi:DNA-binding transcriptional ArsR family regulator
VSILAQRHLTGTNVSGRDSPSCSAVPTPAAATPPENSVLHLQASARALLARLLDLVSARAADLSDDFGVDKGTLSRHLKLLEDLRLVTRQSDTADARSHP